MTMPMSRRTVLTAATLSAGASLIKVSGPGLLLTPVADRPVPVRSPDTAPPGTCPRHLAVLVVNPGAEVPAGAEVTFTYDQRLYAPAEPVIVTAGTHRVEATSTVATDPGTGRTTSRIAVRERIPAGATLLVVAATAHPCRYPYDLVRRPAGSAAAVTPRPGAPEPAATWGNRAPPPRPHRHRRGAHRHPHPARPAGDDQVPRGDLDRARRRRPAPHRTGDPDPLGRRPALTLRRVPPARS